MNSKLTGEGGAVQNFCQKKALMSKKNIDIFNFKQQLLSIDRDINKGKKYALAHFMLHLTTDRYFPDFN